MKEIKVPVLDKGYVRYINHIGSDLDIVNVARTSFKKESTVLSDKDEQLLNYCMREGHFSVLRHAVYSFELKAPLMVTNQFWKHIVASTHTVEQNGWNENSQRYVTLDHEFYAPTTWRKAAKSKKQGSEGVIDKDRGKYYTELLLENQATLLQTYNQALEEGIAPEQARLFLPAYGLYITWRWSVSLEGLLNFLVQRLDDHAQFEIRQYAEVIKEIVLKDFPAAAKYYLKYNGVKV